MNNYPKAHRLSKFQGKKHYNGNSIAKKNCSIYSRMTVYVYMQKL